MNKHSCYKASSSFDVSPIGNGLLCNLTAQISTAQNPPGHDGHSPHHIHHGWRNMTPTQTMLEFPEKSFKELQATLASTLIFPFQYQGTLTRALLRESCNVLDINPHLPKEPSEKWLLFHDNLRYVRVPNQCHPLKK